MPIYDFKCPSGCGYFNDVVLSIKEKEHATCSSCGGSLQTVIRAVATIGPMPSKPLVVGQVGKSFDSQAAWNKYQRENPDVEILSASSEAWKKHKDAVRVKAEDKAKKAGFRDLEDRWSKSRKAKQIKA